MKVHAFKVTTGEVSNSLNGVLSLINKQLDLRKRIRIINQAELRVEFLEQRDGLWLIDFVRIRTDHGPGKVGRDSEVEGFDFDEEEGFGEETAALYDPTTNYILVQYNHYGVRAAQIADYLSAYDKDASNLFTFKPKFDEDVERRLLSQGVTRKICFTLDASKMSAQDRQRGAPLSEAIEYGRRLGGDKIKVEISVGSYSEGGLLKGARDSINALLGIAGQNPGAVTKLEVSGREDRDSVTEVLDLIGQRLSVEFADLNVGADLRFPREERWAALIRAKNGWSKLLTV